jgi:hypothetical protein
MTEPQPKRDDPLAPEKAPPRRQPCAGLFGIEPPATRTPRHSDERHEYGQVVR